MEKLGEFINKSNVPAKLIRAVVSQLGGWEAFKEIAPDIINHGIDGGFRGFIYHTDTVAFFKRNRAAIMDLAEDQCRDIGYEGLFNMFASFNCMKTIEAKEDEIAKAIYTYKGECADNILNCLSWYAGEEVARSYCDMLEEE